MTPSNIIWSPTARLTYFNILEYLNEKWTIKELKFFINRTETVIQNISIHPKLYSYSKESDIYKCVLVKQVSLFYIIKDEYVELLIFWDNRQDLTKLSNI
ncbi:type II toxin-antitoxin system RelE/ParE family toxin [Pedobacter cryophilus]|uniref:Type II toxin-antitoxin system RelE/ParE family toxin n=1 Tax=Pedobacter cryophilus TaxID=2571271 RepID=A0A4U1C195_9SPHI|nr:hypothetical protein [Pedobacter cryophilus]TKB98734.1 hypothetical protein FA046_06350 [Pedobacter cryophilus]